MLLAALVVIVALGTAAVTVMAATVVITIATRIVVSPIIVSRAAKVRSRWRWTVIGAMAMIVVSAAFAGMVVPIVAIAIF